MKVPAIVLPVAAVAVLGVRTEARNRDWKNNFTLFEAAVHAAPNSAKVRSNLGLLYMNAGQAEPARNEFETALRIDPDYPDALASYGLLDLRQGDIADAEQMMEKAFYTSGRDNPNYDFMAVNLAGLWMQKGENFEAMQLLNREIAESPGYARAWANRAVIRYRLGQTAAARADAETALRLDGNNPQALQLMGQLNAGPLAASQR